MHCNMFFLMVTTDLKRKVAVYPETGIVQMGCLQCHTFRLLILSASLCKDEPECV